MHRFSVPLTLLLALLCGRALTQTGNNGCNGIFDFYFVLDSSGSLGTAFREEVVPFVQSVVNNFVNPDLRVSFITFANPGGSRTHLSLTRVGDSDSIQAGIDSLLRVNVEGNTNLGPGLIRVSDQIEGSTLQRTSAVLVITDGLLSDFNTPTGAVFQANRARDLGASIFAIGLGVFVSRDQLNAITGDPAYVHIQTSVTTLDLITETIINGTCIEIISASPDMMCLGNLADVVTVVGRGFTNDLVADVAACQFTTSDRQVSTSPFPPVLFDRIECPVPQDIIDGTGEVLLQVTSNGVHFSNPFTLTILECVVDIEITSVSPDMMCLGNLADVITVEGRGFTNDLVADVSACQFRSSDGQLSTSAPSPPVLFDRIECPMPQDIIEGTREVRLQVTSNGVDFFTNTVTITILDCDDGSGSGGGGGGGGKPNPGLVAGIILGLLALLVLLALLLLWCCCPIICGTIVGGLPPEEESEPEPEPEPVPAKPGRKWEVVDASYYGRGGAGGIAPMTVRWGRDGATEQGSKLTKAKDANVVTVVEIPETPAVAVSVPPKVQVKLGCWELFKRKVKRWYAVVASYRPVRTEMRVIVWCPGPHHAIYNPKPAPSSKGKTATNRVALERKSSSQAVLQIDATDNGASANANGTTTAPPPPRPPRRPSSGRSSVLNTENGHPAQPSAPRPRPPPPPPPPPPYSK